MEPGTLASNSGLAPISLAPISPRPIADRRQRRAL